MSFCEQFTRFPGGHMVEISFDGDGNIEEAYMFEGDKQIDITNYVKSDRYWNEKVLHRLDEIRAQENKKFKQFREVQNG